MNNEILKLHIDETVQRFQKVLEYEQRLGLIGEKEKEQKIKNFKIEYSIAIEQFKKENNI